MTLQLRDVSGYALLESADTTSADGTKGKLLRFGHDEDDKPYVYGVAIFAAQGRLFVVEAGGQKELLSRARACRRVDDEERHRALQRFPRAGPLVAHLQPLVTR